MLSKFQFKEKKLFDKTYEYQFFAGVTKPVLFSRSILLMSLLPVIVNMENFGDPITFDTWLN